MTTATTPMTEQTAGVPPELLLGDHQSGVQLVRQHARGRWFKSLALLAGSGYGVAWVVGLVVWPSNLSIDASRRDIVSLYAAHTRQAAVQYLLVEGLAGALLGIVLFYCVRRLSRCARTWTSQVAFGGGVVVAISLLQCLLGQDLVFSASKGHLDQSGDIYQLINRLDGAKQLALSVCVARAGHPSSSNGELPTVAQQDHGHTWPRSRNVWTGLSPALGCACRHDVRVTSPSCCLGRGKRNLVGYRESVGAAW